MLLWQHRSSWSQTGHSPRAQQQMDEGAVDTTKQEIQHNTTWFCFYKAQRAKSTHCGVRNQAPADSGKSPEGRWPHSTFTVHWAVIWNNSCAFFRGVLGFSYFSHNLSENTKPWDSFVTRSFNSQVFMLMQAAGRLCPWPDLFAVVTSCQHETVLPVVEIETFLCEGFTPFPTENTQTERKEKQEIKVRI